ncbi:hypothetical protein DPMN_011599 [Dreissena polymorpha]|uniref:Uncharacterized protein n=1 Tax=Dreissena polymorpha TaxID=45954 RepID=A0A9D4S0F6_DREPO|nr:hypothetical protein DPMN_011599 [Dreissena polymorpha]
MVLGATGIGVLSTIIAAPIAIAMEGAALGIGLLSIVGSQTNKKLSMKAEKHEKIKTLADAKLNTIRDLISKALADDRISDEEYSLNLSELDKFNQMKEEIRSKIRVGLDEETKQYLIAKGRDDAILSFQNMFSKSKQTFIKKTNTAQTTYDVRRKTYDVRRETYDVRRYESRFNHVEITFKITFEVTLKSRLKSR